MRGAALQPAPEPARHRGVRGVQVVHPRYVAGVRVPAVGNHRAAGEPLRLPLSFGCQQRGTGHVRPERTAHAVDVHSARALQIRPHAVRDEVHVSARRRRKA
jgi:hypothetical protein